MSEQNPLGCSQGSGRALSKGCAKTLLITLNLFCILAAVWTLCFTGLDARFMWRFVEDPRTHWMLGELIRVATCALFMTSALLGCVAAHTEKPHVLFTYTMFVLSMVVVKLLVVILVAVRRSGLQYRASRWLHNQFNFNATRTHAELTDRLRFWDSLQAEYVCCGVNGPEDYAAIGRSISLSCCGAAYRATNSTAQSLMFADCIESASYYSAGCEDVIQHLLLRAPARFFLVIICSYVVEFLGIPLAMWMAYHVKKGAKFYRDNNYSDTPNQEVHITQYYEFNYSFQQ